MSSTRWTRSITSSRCSNRPSPRREAFCRQRGIPYRVDEPSPHAVVPDEQREIAVGRAEVLCRDQRRVRGVRGARELGVAVALPRGKVGEHRDLHVEEADVDVRADARARPFHERGADAERSADTAAVVDVGDPGLGRRSVGLAGQAHHARQRLDGVVVPGTLRVGAGLAVAGEGAGDDRRVHRVQRVVAEPELRQHPGAVVVDHDVGSAHEILDHRTALVGREPHTDRALAAVEREEVQRLLALEVRAHRPRVVGM